MKIQLIKAPTQNTGMPEHDWYTPLNLIWLANYLIPHGYEVEILDGQLLTLQEIIEKISAEVVGVSFDILSIDAFDTIIFEAKSRGSFTIAGGHLATALGPALINGNRYLDVVVCYDGEEALLGILYTLKHKGNLKKNIPNLIFRQNGQLIQTPIIETDLNTLPLPRRKVGGIDLELYFYNFQTTKREQKFNFNYVRPTNTYSHKGCLFRTNGKGCSFCSRVDTHFRQKSAAQVYEEYKYLVDEFDIDQISDFSDSWIYTPFVRKLWEQFEIHGSLNSSLRVYGDVRLITSENVSIMRDIGIDTVLLGIESGNEEILRRNGKPISRKQILSAVELLSMNGIKVADAYVLGLIGETRQSVGDTVSLSYEIRRVCDTEISYFNIMTPLPGSKAWKNLYATGVLNSEFNFPDDYHLNPEQLEKLAINTFCQLGDGGYEYICDVRNEMISNAKIASAEFVPASQKNMNTHSHKRKGNHNGNFNK